MGQIIVPGAEDPVEAAVRQTLHPSAVEKARKVFQEIQSLREQVRVIVTLLTTQVRKCPDGVLKISRAEIDALVREDALGIVQEEDGGFLVKWTRKGPEEKAEGEKPAEAI